MLCLLVFWLALSAAAALLGAKLFARSPRREGLYLFLAAYPVIVLGLWVAIVWILSLAHLLALPGLLLSGAGVLASSAWLARSRTSESTAGEVLSGFWERRCRLLLFLPVFCLLAFLLWKGFVLPTSNPDALYLHLPRAVEITRNAGLPLGRDLAIGWGSYGTYPLNYEGILASILCLSGQDTYTEWFTTWTLGLSCSLVIGVSGVVRERASLRQISITLLLFVCLPVLVLQGATDKVDIATAVVSASSLFWLYWWLERDGRTSIFLLSWASACMAVGFKRTGVLFLATCALGLVCKLTRNGWRSALSLIAAALGAGLSLGFVGVANNFFAFRGVFGADGGIQNYNRFEGSALFDPSQLVTYPALLNLVPFSSAAGAVYVPWRSDWWYWPATNLFFSHWGLVFNALVVVSFVVAPYWVREALRGRRAARLPLIALGAFLVIVAKSYAYAGGFNSYPRYTLFFAAFVAVYLALPLVELLTKSRRASVAAFALAAVWLAANAIYYTEHDDYAPFAQVWRRWREPEARRIVPTGARRVPCLVDRAAGPDAVIATDLTYMTWVHPLYGKDLRRPVHILRPSVPGKFDVPKDAEWIVADNISNVVWGGKAATTAGEQLRAFHTGRPAERDTALFRQLQHDPRFALIYVANEGAEAVFRRKPLR